MSRYPSSYPVAAPRKPFWSFLVPVPVVCFSGALLTDITYSRSPDMQWTNFSAWLLAVGMAFAVLAALIALIDFLVRRPSRNTRRSYHFAGRTWLWIIGSIVVMILALFNNFVHSRDAWTSVVPTGLTLSVLTVTAIVVTSFFAHPLVYTDAPPRGDVS